jgi:hypothetical protein
MDVDNCMQNGIRADKAIRIPSRDNLSLYIALSNLATGTSYIIHLPS